MSKSYEIFEALCKEKDVTPYKVSKATGVSSSYITGWKKGDFEPRDEKLRPIADYFGCSVERLKGLPDPVDYDRILGVVPNRSKARTMTNALYEAMTDMSEDKSLYYLDNEAAAAAQEIFDNRDLKMLFDTARGANAKDIKLVTDTLRRLKGSETGNDETGC